MHHRDKRSPSVRGQEGEREKKTTKKAWGVSHCPRDSQCQGEGTDMETTGGVQDPHLQLHRPAPLCSPCLPHTWQPVTLSPFFPSQEDSQCSVVLRYKSWLRSYSLLSAAALRRCLGRAQRAAAAGGSLEEQRSAGKGTVRQGGHGVL